MTVFYDKTTKTSSIVEECETPIATEVIKMSQETTLTQKRLSKTDLQTLPQMKEIHSKLKELPGSPLG